MSKKQWRFREFTIATYSESDGFFIFLTALMCSFIFVVSRKWGDNSSGAIAMGMFERKTSKQVARELATMETEIDVRSPMPIDE